MYATIVEIEKDEEKKLAVYDRIEWVSLFAFLFISNILYRIALICTTNDIF